MKHLLTASLLLLAIACSNSHTTSSSSSFMDIEGAPGMEIGFGELTLLFDETIHYHQESRYNSETGSSSESTINGLILSVQGTTLHLGETQVEGVHAGDKVELGKGGILVNGELRAPMPAPLVSSSLPASTEN